MLHNRQVWMKWLINKEVKKKVNKKSIRVSIEAEMVKVKQNPK